MDDEKGAYERAVDELKRIDHLIYVSLKYTRTVDVIRNIVDRMIAASDIVFDELLRKAERSQKIFEIPISPSLRCNVLRQIYKQDPQLLSFVEFYLLLRQFKNAQYTSRQEFRRYVTMTATFPNGTTKELDIDNITGYYHDLKDYIKYSRGLIEENGRE